MINRTWTVTLPNGQTQKFEQDLNVVNGKVAPVGSTMSLELDVFLAGLEKMREAGASIVEGTR